MEEEVILVDTRDNQIGTMSKLEAHEAGALHRAISVFVFNSQGEMLLQRRAAGKYHSAGLWSNACCTHPRPGENAHEAALRRLKEEMGVATPLAFSFAFLYSAELEKGLIEHELDHVFVGHSDADPEPDPDEVGEWRWVPTSQVSDELAATPGQFTAWFPLALEQVLARLPMRTGATEEN